MSGVALGLRRKARRYLDEVAYCARSAPGLADAGRLLGRTLAFHLGNGLGAGRDRESAERPFRTRLSIAGEPWDVWLRAGSGDLFVLYEVLMDESYRLPAGWLAGGATVVDLGANIGLTSLYFAGMAPEARFLCLEPDPANLELMKRNLGFLGERLTAVEGAIGPAGTTADFARGRRSWEGRLGGAGDRFAVRCYSLVELLDRAGIERVDLLKVDVEGGERHLLETAVEWSPRVKHLIIELHDPITYDDLEAALSPYGWTTHPPGSPLGNSMIVATRGGAA